MFSLQIEVTGGEVEGVGGGTTRLAHAMNDAAADRALYYSRWSVHDERNKDEFALAI